MENMEVSTDVSSTSVSTEVSSPSQAPAIIESAGEMSSSPSVSSAYTASKETESNNTPAAYTPNYKVKAYDTEYEIPEAYRSFINEKNEKEFRQLFSKAYGLEVMQSKNIKLREENDGYKKEISEKYLPLARGIALADKYLAAKDYDSLFGLLKIEEPDLQSWMLTKLQIKGLPPEQQELYTKNSTTQKQLYELEQANEQFRQELEGLREHRTQEVVQKRAEELDTILNRSDIKSIVDRYDTSKNQAGSFKDQVIQRAQFIFQTKGEDLSAEQAVEDFMKLIMLDAPKANPNNTVIPPKTGHKAPTLPNVAGQTNSPAAQKVTSMADLQKLKKQAIAALNTQN